MVRLHHGRWERDSRSGVFRSPHYLRFHDAMMRRLLERGELELLWLVVRGEPAAALYGMTCGDIVYAYQTGRRLDVPSSVRPGGVILAHAIRRAIEAGRRSSTCWPTRRPTNCNWPRRCGRSFRSASFGRGYENRPPSHGARRRVCPSAAAGVGRLSGQLRAEGVKEE